MNKYEKISIEVRDRIKSGYYPQEHPIPDEHSLAKEFNCSRMTIKRALDVLVMEGLLFRKRGHGTFIIQTTVKDTELNVMGAESLGFSRLVTNQQVKSKIIAFDIEFPSDEVAHQLVIEKNEPVYHIIRLRIVDDEPFVIEETYMPSKLIPDITEEVLHKSVYRHIQDTLDLKIGVAHRKIRACKSNEFDQKYLDCKSDDPVLEVEQVGYLNTGIPFEYSFSRHRYDKFVFTTVTVSKQ